MYRTLIALGVTALPLHVAAQETGDAEAGRAQFARQCVACHVIENADGAVIAGRNARTGPNLHGVTRRPAAGMEGYNYGDSLAAWGQAGGVWDEANLTAYVQAPTDFLRAALDDRRARSRMAYQVRVEADARDLWAYLSSEEAGG